MRYLLAAMFAIAAFSQAQASTFSFEMPNPPYSGSWQLELTNTPARFNVQIFAEGGPTINRLDECATRVRRIHACLFMGRFQHCAPVLSQKI
jgi:hypothetical protein